MHGARGRRSHAAAAAAVTLFHIAAIVLLASSSIEHAAAHSSGAGAQACAAGAASQMPGHGSAFQSSPAPFAVHGPSPAAYSAGGAAVPFTVSANDGTSTYEGFLCSVFYAADTAGATRVGQVGPGAGETQTQPVCVSGSNGGITHNPATPRASRSFLWTPPPIASAGLGAAMIQCTVITSLSTYWKLPPFTLSEQLTNGAPPSPSAFILTDALVVGDGSSTLTFGFTAPQAQGLVDKYVLDYWPQSNPAAVLVSNITKNASTAAYSVPVSALTASTAFTFRLRSFNEAAGFQTDAALTLALTTSSSAAAVPASPPAVSNATLSVVGLNVVIDLSSFAPASDAPLIGYDVQYRLSTEATFGTHASIFAKLAQGSATITGLATGQTIFVHVCAKSMRGTGAFGPEIQYKVAMCPNGCSGHGSCSASSVCTCSAGFLSSDCSIPSRVVGGAKCFKNFCMDFGLEGSGGSGAPLTSGASVARVHFHISARTHGYVGFLLDTFDGMTNGPGFYFTRDADDSTAAYLIFSKILDEPDVKSTGGDDVKASARGYLDPSNPAVTVFTFSKEVHSYPALELEGRQLFSWAYASDNRWSMHDADGKLIVDFWAGTIIKMPHVNYFYVYAPMIAFILVTLGLAYVFSMIPALRYCAVGNLAFQRRVGDWSGKVGGAIGFATMDAWPTIQDFLLGEVVVVCLYVFGVAGFVAVGYREFPAVVIPDIFTWGHLSAMHFALLLVPVNKNSLWAWLLQSSFERLIKWHRIAGRLAIVWTLVHMFTMFRKYGKAIATNNPNVLYGTLSLIFFSIVVATAWEPIRRGYWKLFITVHLVFAPVGYLMAFLHTKIAVFFAILPLLLVTLDYLFRWIIRPSWIHTDVKLAEARVIVDGDGSQGEMAAELRSGDNLIKVGDTIAAHGGIGSSVGRITHLTLDVTGFSQSVEPGSYCYLQIPSVSLNDFHPFSISCNPVMTGSVSRLTFHILDMGRDSFTHRLFNRVASASAADLAALRVRVDGPYGHLQVDLARYKTIVLVAGGIGIAPLLSILEWIASQKLQCTVHLIWSARVHSALSAWAGTLLRRLHDCDGSAQFHFHLYSTAPKSVDARVVGRSAMDTRFVQEQQMTQLPARDPLLQHAEDVAAGSLPAMAPLDCLAQGPWKPALTPGRPDLPALFAGFARDAAAVDLSSLPAHHAAFMSRHLSHTVAVLTCGPASLVAAAQSAARANDFHFHKEVFAF